MQGQHQQLSYELIEESGPDHNKSFTVATQISGEQIAAGTGRTKKAAEQEAAYRTLLVLRQTAGE